VPLGREPIRLLFDRPLKVKHISLVLEETENSRTQEFVLRWSSDLGHSFRELVRQQWNFSPPGTVREAEDYQVDLLDVTAMELEIVPNKAGARLWPRLRACVWLEISEFARTLGVGDCEEYGSFHLCWVGNGRSAPPDQPS
jgi:hypothetical protein